MKEKEFSLEYKAIEMELHNAKTHTVKVSELPCNVGKHIHFISPFQESHVDKFLCILEKPLPV